MEPTAENVLTIIRELDHRGRGSGYVSQIRVVQRLGDDRAAGLAVVDEMVQDGRLRRVIITGSVGDVSDEEYPLLMIS